MIFILTAGYAFPSDAPYLLVNCSIGNNVKMYLPTNSLKYFYIDVDNSQIYNTSDSTRYTYTTDYQIRWQPYSEGTYYYNNNYNQRDINITKILEDHRFDNDEINYDYHLNIMLFAVAGGILLCLFILLLK